jgi:SprT protein
MGDCIVPHPAGGYSGPAPGQVATEGRDGAMQAVNLEPIGEAQRRLVRQATDRFIAEGEAIFSRRFERVPVLFDLRGTAAGMFKVIGRKRWIRYNPWIFAKHFEDNLADTVPHEVAHFIVHEVFGRRGVRPHGEEWRMLMEAFGAEPRATFHMDLEGVPQRRQRTHPYRCLCRDHAVSTTRHNRMVRGTGRYHCRYCDGKLVYDG